MDTFKKVLIASFGSVTMFAFSQNQQDIQKMKTQTDTVALKKLAEMLKNSKPSKEALQKKAKELGIPYSGTKANGSYFELQGFEKDGRPIYYTTFQKPSDEKISKMPLKDDVASLQRQEINSEKKQAPNCRPKRKKKK